MRTASSAYTFTGVVIVLAGLAALGMYQRYTTKPWTRDGQVRGNIVGIASRVAGPIIQIPVRDNQAVKKGDLLFEVDPATYQVAIDESAAKLQETRAAEIQAQQELQRQSKLYHTHVTDLRDLQNAQNDLAAATAKVAAATAELESAKLNLAYTKVFAPVDGYLTNVNLSPGTYVHTGEQVLTLVDASSFWIAAYFKETQLQHVKAGGKARLTFIGREDQPFDGKVDSVAWGIFDPNGSTVGMLPRVSQTIDWVRLPNRFPVRILVTGTPPIPLRIGQTISIAMSGE